MKRLWVILFIILIFSCEDKDKDERSCEEKEVAMTEASAAFEANGAGKNACSALITALNLYIPCVSENEEKDLMEAYLVSVTLFCVFY